MNVARFFRDEAQHEAKTGGNSYTGPTYATPRTIHVRWHLTNELVRDAAGQEVVTSGHISTTSDVSLGDRITDADGTQRDVILVRANQDTRGRFTHRVAYLK